MNVLGIYITTTLFDQQPARARRAQQPTANGKRRNQKPKPKAGTGNGKRPARPPAPDARLAAARRPRSRGRGLGSPPPDQSSSNMDVARQVGSILVYDQACMDRRGLGRTCGPMAVDWFEVGLNYALVAANAAAALSATSAVDELRERRRVAAFAPSYHLAAFAFGERTADARENRPSFPSFRFLL